VEKETAQGVASQLAPVQPAKSARAVFGGVNDPFALQRAVGNQGMQRLLESGGLQAKLRVSQPGDADEQDADQAAEQIISAQAAPRLQRKCACGGSCSRCQEEQEQIIHRSARTTPPTPQSFPFSIQRQASTTTTEESSHRAPAAEAGARRDQAQHPGEHPRALIVEDGAPSLAAGQMHKTQFLNLLQSRACATVDEVLKSVGHSTKRCPYIEKWLEYYRDKDAQYLMRVMHKYVPETARARTAHEAIGLMSGHARRAALTWARTGKVTEVPDGLPDMMLRGDGVPSGARKGSPLGADGRVQKKSRNEAAMGEPDAAAVKEQLGSGHSLDHRVQSQMSAAFGYDFSAVRVHTDATAGQLSGQFNARAFTIGSDVAFAGGEYRPGTLIGDALIAHELAHVIQQGGGSRSSQAQTKAGALGQDDSLEQDADRSAVGAVVSAWTGLRRGFTDVGAAALPRLKSGLRLQRCVAVAAAPEVAALAGGGAVAGEVTVGGLVTADIVGTGVVGTSVVGTGAVGTGVVGTGAVGTGVVGTGVVGAGVVGTGVVETGIVGTGVVGTGAAGTGAVTTGVATGTGVAGGTGVATGTGLTTALRIGGILAATQVSDEPHPQEREKPEERKKPICATEYPGIPLCDSLPSGYSFQSVSQALEALKK